MADPYTHKNIDEVEDSAEKFGHGEVGEAKFASEDFDTEQTGLSFHRLKPGKRQAFGHRHDEVEEVYFVASGSGRVKLDDDNRRSNRARRDPRLAKGDALLGGRRRRPRGPRLQPPPQGRPRRDGPGLVERLT